MIAYSSVLFTDLPPLKDYSRSQVGRFKNTVEPPNKGHFGAGYVVLFREVVLFSEVQMY